MGSQLSTICECYYDCRESGLTGEFHQHSDEPCPAHPDAPDENGVDPTSFTGRTK